MEKKTYILIYSKYIAGTGELLHFSTLGVYSLSRGEMEALDFKLFTALSKKNSTETGEVLECIFFKEANIAPYEKAEVTIEEALKEQNINLKF